MLSTMNTFVLICGFLAAAQAMQAGGPPVGQNLNATQDYKGIWYWTWSGWANSPPGANIGELRNYNDVYH